MAKQSDKTQKKVGRIAGTIAELKQVSWPTFSTTMKKLGTVLIITGIFLLVVMGMDALLRWLYSSLVMGVVGTHVPVAGGWGYYSRPSMTEGANPDIMEVGSMIAAAAVAAALITIAIVTIIIMKSRKKDI